MVFHRLKRVETSDINQTNEEWIHYFQKPQRESLTNCWLKRYGFMTYLSFKGKI